MTLILILFQLLPDGRVCPNPISKFYPSFLSEPLSPQNKVTRSSGWSLLNFDAHNFMLSTKSLNKDLKSYLVLLNTVFLDICLIGICNDFQELCYIFLVNVFLC